MVEPSFVVKQVMFDLRQTFTFGYPDPSPYIDTEDPENKGLSVFDIRRSGMRVRPASSMAVWAGNLLIAPEGESAVFSRGCGTTGFLKGLTHVSVVPGGTRSFSWDLTRDSRHGLSSGGLTGSNEFEM
jgi:hypothetical protein